MLCVDEKTQIQALDRTAPVLPLRPGLPERRTHDYVRHGTTNLYAALDLASGQVIADMTDAHRADRVPQLLEPDRPLRSRTTSTCTWSSTTSPPTRPPRSSAGCCATRASTLHFTPTYSSWLNLVERWFAELTTKWLRRGTHRSTGARGIDHRRGSTSWNEDPKPFVWHKTADEILETLAAYCQRMTSDSGH